MPVDTPLTFYITGFAAINRELGRTWNVRATYNRSVNYVPGFVAPFFNNAFQKRKVMLTVIDGGHWLLALLVQGAVLGLLA